MARKSKSKQAPISSHPVFPAVVALWFAALLGLGSLVLPVVLFEKAMTATGIASVFPSAQAPLGATARLSIAVAAAVAGMLAGLFVARKVAEAQGETSPARKPTKFVTEEDGASGQFEGSSKKPISAMEELGEEGLDEPLADQEDEVTTAYKGKRRSLAVTDDSGPSDFFEHAPLPGGDAIFDGANNDEALELEILADQTGPDKEDQASGPDPEPSPFDALAAQIDDEYRGDGSDPIDEPHFPGGIQHTATSAQADPFAPPTNSPEFAQPEQAAAPLQQEPVSMNDFTRPTSDEPYNPFARHAVEAGDGPGSFDGSFAQDRSGDQTQSSANSEPAPMEAPLPQSAPLQSAPMPEQLHQQPAAPSAPVSARPLKELGVAELVERFAHALQTQGHPDQSAPAAATATSIPVAGNNGVPSEPVAPPQPFAAAEPDPEAAGNVPAAEPAPAPMVFRRSNSEPQPDTREAAPPASAPAPLQPAATAQPERPYVPAALQPLGFDDAEDEAEEDNYGVGGLSLSLQHKPMPFSPPTSPPASPPAPPQAAPTAPPMAAPPSQPAEFQLPAQQVASGTSQPFGQLATDDDAEQGYDAGTDAGYSSLLNMKSGFAPSDDFVRIEDDDENHGVVEPVVVFPGQNDRQAAPAADGPARDPFPANGQDGAAPVEQGPASRPFDAPAGAQQGRPRNQGNSEETEQALREALEKLQRMSG